MEKICCNCKHKENLKRCNLDCMGYSHFEAAVKTYRLCDLEITKEYISDMDEMVRVTGSGVYQWSVAGEWRVIQLTRQWAKRIFTEVKKKTVKKTVELFAGGTAMCMLRGNCHDGQLYKENNNTKTRQKVSVTFEVEE